MLLASQVRFAYYFAVNAPCSPVCWASTFGFLRRRSKLFGRNPKKDKTQAPASGSVQVLYVVLGIGAMVIGSRRAAQYSFLQFGEQDCLLTTGLLVRSAQLRQIRLNPLPTRMPIVLTVPPRDLCLSALGLQCHVLVDPATG
jgi:hypothetical protein